MNVKLDAAPWTFKHSYSPIVLENNKIGFNEITFIYHKWSRRESNSLLRRAGSFSALSAINDPCHAIHQTQISPSIKLKSTVSAFLESSFHRGNGLRP